MQLVSICIPTYEGDKYLQEALDSVKKQTYKNIEVIISDDDSKDTTLSICEKFKKEVDFPVFIYRHKPNGIGANWNHCIRKANGDYIKFLFQDDVLQSNCIEKQVLASQDSCLKAICSKRTIINDNSIIVEDGDWFAKYGDLQKNINFGDKSVYVFEKKDLKSLPYLVYNQFGEPDTFLYSKDLFKELGFFNEKYNQILDLEYTYRILKKHPIGLMKDNLLSFRVHTGQASTKTANIQLQEHKELIGMIQSNFFSYLSSKERKNYLLKKYKVLAKIYYLKKKYFK